MTLNETLLQAYAWADQNAQMILLAGVLLPVVGTILARIGKAGKTDADGRFIASAVMAVAMLAVVVEVGGLLIARDVLQASLLQANALLLVAPVLCLAGCIVGIRWVFPLSELGSVRMLVDLGLLLLACLGVLWLLSQFRGWGIVFFGSLGQLVVLAVIALFFLWRLFRRAFGLDRRRSDRLSVE